MKIIRIIFFSLLALSLIISAGIFILFQTFNTDQFLPKFTQKASFALGRPVSIGQVGLGLSSQGITLDIGPVIIADDEDFTSQPFIKIDRIRIVPDLKSLILQRQIIIRNILLQSPQIHFIRSEEGSMNIHSLAHASVNETEPVSDSPQGEAITEGTMDNRGRRPIIFKISNENNRALSPIIIKSIIIRNASISFIDQSATYPMDIWLTHIKARFDDLSLDLSKRSFHLALLGIHADLSRLDIKNISPDMPGSEVLRNIAGVVQLNLSRLDLDASSGLTSEGGINITNGAIKNFNIIKTILSQTLGVFGDIDGLLNGSLKSTLGANDTNLQNASVRFSLHDKAVFIDDLTLATNIFELTAHGSVDQGLNVDMQTMLHLNTDISTALINEIDGLKFLCDDSHRIAIDADLKGTYLHLKYKPNKDFRKKSKKTFNAMFRQLFGA